MIDTSLHETSVRCSVLYTATGAGNFLTKKQSDFNRFLISHIIKKAENLPAPQRKMTAQSPAQSKPRSAVSDSPAGFGAVPIIACSSAAYNEERQVLRLPLSSLCLSSLSVFSGQAVLSANCSVSKTNLFLAALPVYGFVTSSPQAFAYASSAFFCSLLSAVGTETTSVT